MAAFQDIQVKFLDLIKSNLPENISLADEIADVLHISKDSAYRRLRGETTLSLNEIQKLCSQFGVSIDTLLHVDTDSVTFQYRSIDNENFTFEDYLQFILGNLTMLSAFEVKQLTYLAKDVPPFHHFQFPRLAEFKYFFWLKTILYHPKYADRVFEFDSMPKEYVEVGSRIWEEYVRIPSLEVWTYETINITLRQIEFYLDCGLFANPKEAETLVDTFEQEIHHVKAQAEKGYKFHLGTDEVGPPNSYQMFSNEVNIPDTTIFFQMGDTKIAYVTHNNLNILTTSNKDFCDNTDSYIQNILRKSSMISTSGEKERTKFFNRLSRQIDETRSLVKRYQ